MKQSCAMSNTGLKTVLIDNYDSFTYNIVQYLEELGADLQVFENDRITLSELRRIEFENLLLSPGAGKPDGAGICLEAIGAFYREKKILGICLGHQCIAQFFGAKIVKAKEPMHGKQSAIFFNADEPLFKGFRQGFSATRYHSLVAAPETIKNKLVAIANTEEGVNMGIKHSSCPVYGVQFHPEAILTEYGKELLWNFLSL